MTLADNESPLVTFLVTVLDDTPAGGQLVDRTVRSAAATMRNPTATARRTQAEPPSPTPPGLGGRLLAVVHAFNSENELLNTLYVDQGEGAVVPELDYFADYAIARVGQETRETAIPRLVRAWVGAFQITSTGGSATSNDLGARVEVLIADVERLVLSNEELLRTIEERDQVVDQLRGVIRTLHAELQRARISPTRVNWSVRALQAILTTIVLPFTVNIGSGLTTNAIDPPEPRVIVVEQPGQLGEDVRELVARCHEVVAAAVAAEDALPAPP